jgi:hypothetical protein
LLSEVAACRSDGPAGAEDGGVAGGVVGAVAGEDCAGVAGAVDEAGVPGVDCDTFATFAPFAVVLGEDENGWAMRT